MEVCIATGGFSLENSRTKNSRRECRLSVSGVPRGYACPGACVLASVSTCVRVYAYVRPSVRPSVPMCVRMWHGLLSSIQANKPKRPTKTA